MKTKKELQKIIDDQKDSAEAGHAGSQQAVINAQADLDMIAHNELAEYIAKTPLPDPLILVD